MKILAIETSCDETAIAVIEGLGTSLSAGKAGGKGIEFKVLSNIVLSQIKTHKPFGGVVPNLAKREHQKNLPVVLKTALKEAKISPKKIGAIAVTYGPGLEPALWTGINFAEELAKKWKKPLIPVNHLEGHIYSSYLPPQSPLLTKERGKKKRVPPSLLTKEEGGQGDGGQPKFPILALIVSGGHTELVLMKKHLNYKILGETLDDAAGEAFDKVARLLKLGYPGGPEISKLAQKFKGKSSISFPRPMINSPDLNFSFSGLKTAVLYYLRDNPNVDKSEVAYEFEQAVVDVLLKKTEKALKKYKSKSLVVGGGVAANKALRQALENLAKKYPSTKLFLSPMWLTGDNAAMIAVASYFRARAKKFAKHPLKANGNLKLK